MVGYPEVEISLTDKFWIARDSELTGRRGIADRFRYADFPVLKQLPPLPNEITTQNLFISGPRGARPRDPSFYLRTAGFNTSYHQWRKLVGVVF